MSDTRQLFELPLVEIIGESRLNLSDSITDSTERRNIGLKDRRPEQTRIAYLFPLVRVIISDARRKVSRI